jgi:adenylate cyclase
MNDVPPNASSPSAPRTGRHLAAIAFADVVGYTALVAADEGSAFAHWQGVLARVIHPQAERHRGTVVQVMGDGVLAEFPSALDAFDWARAVQRRLADDADAEGGTQAMALRIAVHCGEVVSTAGGLFGDAVNIAARLQEHTEAGGSSCPR